MKSMIRFFIVTGLAIIVMSAPASAGNIKKWVDENGVTHYGTAVPPQYKNRAHTELNQRGIAIKRHERAKTAEEIEKEKALAALRAEQQKLLQEQQERDRILLSLYRNEDDLVMARDGKITQLDAQIKLKHGDIRRLKNRLSEFQSDAAATERSGKQLNERQKANLESTQRSLEKSYAMILAKEDEKRATRESYDYDLTRFRQLRRGGARAANADVIARSDIPDLVDTAVRCTGADCSRLWTIAQEYARKHATTPIDLAAERILVTAPPRDIRDISITVSRLEDNNAGGERIFLDIQCANFTEAREFCRGSEVSEIRNSFRLALEP